MARQILRPILLLLLSIAAVSAIRAPHATAGDCPLVLALPEDQESLTCTVKDWHKPLIHAGTMAELPAYRDVFHPGGGGFVVGTERGLRISGSGPMEIIFVLEETSDDGLKLPGNAPGNPGPGGGYEIGVNWVKAGTFYRLVVKDPDHTGLILTLAVTGTVGQSVLDAVDYARFNRVDLKVIVRRLPVQCSMWARVTGDVTGTFYGDVAYYLTSTTGVLVDPEAMAMFGLLMGEEMADSFAAALAREAQDANEKKGGKKIKGAEKFALILQDFKLDRELPYLPDSDPGVELFGFGDPASQEALREVAGMIAGQFSLGITADLVPSSDPAKAKLLIDEVKATVGVADYGEAIIFESGGEDASKPALTILPLEGTDLAYGTFSGDLSTRGPYSLADAPSRRLRVHIEANYTARKGQYTCAKQ